MSVLVLGTNVYREVAKKLYYMALSSELGINHSHIARKNKLDNEKKLFDLVNNWVELNDLSYHIAYKENKTTTRMVKGFGKNLQSIDTIQCYKFLQCIHYNIEKCTIEEMQALTVEQDQALEILKKLIDDLATSIIYSMPQYQAAKWCDL